MDEIYRALDSRATIYGIRPHLYGEPITAQQLQSSMTVEYKMTEANRPAIELFFDVCLECKAFGRRNCTCHERGYN